MLKRKAYSEVKFYLEVQQARLVHIATLNRAAEWDWLPVALSCCCLLLGFFLLLGLCILHCFSLDLDRFWSQPVQQKHTWGDGEHNIHINCECDKDHTLVISIIKLYLVSIVGSERGYVRTVQDLCHCRPHPISFAYSVIIVQVQKGTKSPRVGFLASFFP